VAIVADPALAGCVPPGALRVVLGGRVSDLPVECSVVLDLDVLPGATLLVARQTPRQIDQLDAAPIELAEQFARTLAGFRPPRGLEAGDEIYEVQLDGAYRSLK
jgi:hypothetical protein